MLRHDANPLAARHRMPGQPDAWRPALEMYETAAALVVRLDLAGINPDDLAVSLDGDSLIVSGRRLPATGDNPAGEQRSYHEMGIPYGPFHAGIRLPFAVERETIEADYEYGFLTVLLPRAGRDERATETGESREETD